MRKINLTTALTACFLVLLPFGVGSAQQADTSAESPAIKQTVATFIDAFNRHDASAVAKVFTEDAERTTVRGEISHGRKEIETSYAGLFTGRLKTARREATVKSIRLLTPNIALVDSDYEMSGLKTETGGDLPPTKGLLIWVLTKRDRVWSINTFHELEIASAPAR